MDRNYADDLTCRQIISSLSARRAWIEIANGSQARFCPAVALRKESVDRNKDQLRCGIRNFVALRKESVDRNL